ncbi:MAG: UPF0175 family protein [Nanoarchaeota archaeon]
MSEVITARLTETLERDLALVSKVEHLDKSTVLRRLLSDALDSWRKDRALKLYSDGKYSGEQAAKMAKVSLWSFFDILKQKKLPINYDMQEFEKDIKNIKWKQ